MKPVCALLFALYTVLGCAAMVCAAPAATAPQQDLHGVQKAIANTQQQIRQTTVAQKKVDASLNQTRTRLNQAQTELNQLNHQQQTGVRKLQQLQNHLDQLKTEISGSQTQVARLLNAHYRNRQPNAVMLLLKNTNAQQKGRYLQYMRYVNHANETVIRQLRTQQRQLAQQQTTIQQQQQQLRQLQYQQKQVVSRLGRQHQQQQNQVSDLDKQLSSQTQHLTQLKNNEKRLNNLISRLAAQSATRRKTEVLARAKQPAEHHRAAPKTTIAAAKPAHPLPNHATDVREPPAQTNTLTAEEMTIQAPETSAEAPLSNGFAHMQGLMHKPVNGSITGRFGQTRPGGGTWKGLFIATPPAAVHSVAAGEVVYAASLQGYGNTVIIDHGNGYLTIYTGLSNIGVSSGNHVAARQILGRSGQIPGGASGLYFEIRYHNQAMNPLSWLS